VQFNAIQFTHTAWDSADDKAWFANQFVKFVEGGFSKRHFTQRFYRRLSNTFGHIAHFNQHEFWNTFFATTADKLKFLEQTLAGPCYGDPAATYSDVERELQRWLAIAGTLDTFRRQLAAEFRAAERAEYERLRARFESPVR